MNNQIDLSWCGYDWQCCMEGGRIIHPYKPWVWYDRQCIVRVHIDDAVSLDIKPYDKEVTDWQGTFTPQYGGGLIRSVDTFSYGTFSAEIILPKGKGLWPSFWLCGEGPWPDNGEIDVMEGYTDHNCFRLFTPYFPWINPSWTTTTNTHYKLFKKHCEIKPRSISVFKQPINPSKNWIKYEIKWTPEEILFYIDGKVVRKTDVSCWFQNSIVVEDGVARQGMRVVFDCLCIDPKENEISIDKPMYVRNFKYQPL